MGPVGWLSFHGAKRIEGGKGSRFFFLTSLLETPKKKILGRFMPMMGIPIHQGLYGPPGAFE